MSRTGMELLPELRAFVDATKRAVVATEQQYDINEAVRLLQELAGPLVRPEAFSAQWKPTYLSHLYRDVAAFVLGFVANRLEICFSDQQRESAFDVFFAQPHVPAIRSLDVLISTLATAKMQASTANEGHSEEDVKTTVTHCVRLLEQSMAAGALDDAVKTMLELEDASAHARSLASFQPLVSYLGSLPDLVYNRQQRATPSFFRPRHYFALLGEHLFLVLLEHYANKTQLPSASQVFRMFSDKMIRVGQKEVFVQAWLSVLESTTTADSLEVHSLLLKSLPDSCHEAFFLELASTTPCQRGRSAAKYRLIESMPEDLCASSHFQYIVSRKLLLAKPFSDLYFLQVLVDVLARDDPMRGRDAPLCNIFDVVLSRWSQDGFPTSADYALNASICFFLRYSLRKLGSNNAASFEKREWTAKLCKGIQDHMTHSVERVRTLGMRVGESLSTIISPDNLLDFGIEEPDPLDTFGSTEDLESLVSGLAMDGSVKQNSAEQHSKPARRRKKAAPVFALDPDELVESDDDDDDAEAFVKSDGEDSGSDSDVSLDAYDLEDDEEDMTARRPLYLKDLITGLQSDEDRDKTEAALAKAEALLRKKPRDLHENANAVVAALLRLEDKFNTPNFNVLRSKALAAVCALSPQQAIPYLQSQALEREQLLQSRVDALEAMVSAAQELSETGIFAATQSSKKLLQDDLDTRTMQGLKTRRWGYKRDPLAPAKKNTFADHAIGFFSPLLFGYAKYVQTHAGTKGLSDLEQVFLAHVLHTLACFVECAGHAPQTISMAKCLLEFAWHERSNSVAAVRRQVLFCLSRVLLVVPPFLLRQEMGENVLDMMAWLQQVRQQDPDEGCREGSRLLLTSGSIPMITQP